MRSKSEQPDSEYLKSSCVNFYENDLTSLILGESFHPGGEQLTLHLGQSLGIKKDSLVLDVACGNGSSAITLAKNFDCNVVGIDLSQKNIDKANDKINGTPLADKIHFRISDAENIDFEADKFDSVICECALCTFPDRSSAVAEMNRVLKVDGNIGITDVTIEDHTLEKYDKLAYYVACISGAQSVDGYLELIKAGGFSDIFYEDQESALKEMIDRFEVLIGGWETIGDICGCNIETLFDIDRDKVREYLDTAKTELEKKNFGYGSFIARKC